MGRRVRRDETGQSGQASRAPEPTDDFRAVLKEAAALQKRGDRRRLTDGSDLYQQAAAKYKHAIAAANNSSEAEVADARFGLAESLQAAGETVIETSRRVADSVLEATETSAATEGAGLLQEAIQTYQLVQEKGVARTDALVNCGNAFAALADVSAPHEKLGMLWDASNAYRTALSSEEDALTLSNLGDVLVSAAEQMQETPESGGQVQAIYADAMTAYAKACSLSSSENGDDLPGLLHNWGVGLYSAGTHLKSSQALEESVEKLKAAAGFCRGDAAVLVALGDALVATSELSSDQPLAFQLLDRALKEGYDQALRIDRHHTDAHIGRAEAQTYMGRLSAGREASQHFEQSFQAYCTALRQPVSLGGFRDRCEVRFNAACAACLCGDLRAAVEILRCLLELKGVTHEELLNDGDLKLLQGFPDFKVLIGEHLT